MIKISLRLNPPPRWTNILNRVSREEANELRNLKKFIDDFRTNGAINTDGEIVARYPTTDGSIIINMTMGYGYYQFRSKIIFSHILVEQFKSLNTI